MALVAWLEVARVGDEELARFRDLLPEEELAAAMRMSDARLHLCARAFVRAALSRARPDVAPRAWTFARTESGKPFVDGGPCFNVSHTDGLVACAVADTPVGIDVEPLARAPDILDTVLRAFAPAEVEALRARPAMLHARRAVELWTVKEAYLKGLGTGISRHLDRFVVEAVEAPAEITRWRVQESADWRVETRLVAARWVVATAAAANESIAYAPA